MKIYRLFLFIMIIAAVLTFQMAMVKPISALELPAGEFVNYQLTPTETPVIQNGNEVLTTNPVLLQTIILFGILTVLVLFLGVWISRRSVAK